MICDSDDKAEQHHKALIDLSQAITMSKEQKIGRAASDGLICERHYLTPVNLHPSHLDPFLKVKNTALQVRSAVMLMINEDKYRQTPNISCP